MWGVTFNFFEAGSDHDYNGDDNACNHDERYDDDIVDGGGDDGNHYDGDYSYAECTRLTNARLTKPTLLTRLSLLAWLHWLCLVWLYSLDTCYF